MFSGTYVHVINVCSLMLQSSLKLQDDINNRSMKKLSEYVDDYERIISETKSKSAKL